MVNQNGHLTGETILAEAQRLLGAGGYQVRRDAEQIVGLPSERGLIAEDKYGVVVVAVYETWNDLRRDWTEVQGALVSLISNRFTRAEAKAWEGYLFLLTASPIGPEGLQDANSIRYDTHRIRKLVAGGEELTSLKDVERILLPLMPLEASQLGEGSEDLVLDTVPDVLAERGVDRRAVEAVVEAFRHRESLLERLHEWLGEAQ